MEGIAYVFGTGHGPVHRHVSPADASVARRHDAVALDFDGDGRVDDALWDVDGDGIADRSLLDLDDDGRPEHAYADPSGRGVWDAPADLPAGTVGTAGAAGALRWTDVRGRSATVVPDRDTDGDGVDDAAVVDADHSGGAGGAELVCDLDGDGHGEQLLVDADGDGRFERAYLSADPAGPASPSARWDVLLLDTDADGAVDTAVSEGAPGWLPP